MATPQPQQQYVAAPPQATYMTAPPAKKPMSIWWPMSFLIAWVVMSAVGGGLIGGAASMVSYYCSSYGGCYDINDGEGMFWGGVACLVIAGLCGITFWVLLILYLVKRSRAAHPSVVYGNNLPPAQPAGYYPYAYPGGIAPQYPQQAYVPAAMPHASMVPAANKPEGKACASCGTVAATPFCPQCGAQVS